MADMKDFTASSEAGIEPEATDKTVSLSRRTFLLGSAGAVAGATLGAMSLPGTASATLRTAPKTKLTNVSLLLDFLPNVDDVFVAVAEKYGYFADEGLKVTITNPSDAQINSIAELTGLGRFDFGMQAVPEGIFARNAGSPVLAVAGWGRRSEGIISLPPNRVTGPKSLIGKTVATYNAVDFEAFMISFMRSAGLKTSQVNLVNTDFTAPIIASGKAFAGLGLRWGEYLDTESEAKKTPYFLSFFEPYPDKYGIPQMNYMLLYSSESYAKKNPGIVKGFVRAMARGYKKSIVMPTAELSPIMNTWASTGPNATGTLAVNMQKFQAGRFYYFYGANQDPNTASYFEQPLASLPTVAKWLEKTGVSKPIKLGSFATNEFITPGALKPSV